MTHTPLKPCPFCGEPPSTKEWVERNREAIRIWCSQCSVETRCQSLKETAITSWNTRACNMHEELVEALEYALEFLESLPEGWLLKTSGDVGALNNFYCTAPKALKKAKLKQETTHT